MPATLTLEPGGVDYAALIAALTARVASLEAAPGAGVLQSKVITGTRDLAVVGTQDFTGFGFSPTACVILANLGGDSAMSVGFASLGQAMIAQLAANSTQSHGGGGCAVYMASSIGSVQQVGVASFIPDGVRITWTKTGSAAGIANVLILGMR